MSDQDPFVLFDQWLGAAEKSEPNDPNAVCVSSVDQRGFPSSRMVLLKGHDADGFVFYTNLGSRKGQEILAQPQVAMLFHWKSLRRQIRIEGLAAQVTDAEADEYFQSRPRVSQIGAWASLQSQPLNSRFELEKRVAEYTAKFGISPVPRPPHWSGFRVTPVRMEFWQDKPFRLHDRLIYSRADAQSSWATEKLFP